MTRGMCYNEGAQGGMLVYDKEPVLMNGLETFSPGN